MTKAKLEAEDVMTSGTGFVDASPEPAKPTRKKVAGYRTLTFDERMAVHNALNAVVFIKHPDGSVEYPKGCDDNTIAEITLKDYPGDKKGAVAEHRLKYHGKLFNMGHPLAPEKQANVTQSDRIAALEREVKMLTYALDNAFGSAWFTKLRGEFDSRG